MLEHHTETGLHHRYAVTLSGTLYLLLPILPLRPSPMHVLEHIEQVLWVPEVPPTMLKL